MASEDLLKQLRAQLSLIVQTPIDELVKKQEWGSIDFEPARPSLDLAFSLAGHLLQLPIELVPDGPISEFRQRAEVVAQHIQQIRDFSLEASNPKQLRDQLSARLKQHTEEFLVSVQVWIGFLAYQQGDVKRNISELAAAVTTAKRLVGEAETNATNKAKEIEDIIVKAREASASAGVGVFTSDFSGQADTYEGEAKLWLERTFWAAVITVLAAGVSYFLPIDAAATSPQVVQYVSSKIVVVLLLLTATAWCGRLYKAAKHQASVNNHRANALKTFQAFTKAASDDVTRNAVLLETTRCIFSVAPTGYLDSADAATDPGSRVVEVIKSAKEK